MRLPYLTADLPGTGGFLRTNPEDFRVDEIPLYEPCGEGDHVYFRLWKRGLDTFEAIRRVARALDLKNYFRCSQLLKPFRGYCLREILSYYPDQNLQLKNHRKIDL